MRLPFRRFGFLSCLLLLLARQAQAAITLIGVGTIPGDATDLSGLMGATSDGTPSNRLGGLGSAIAYTGKGTEYVLVSDRGPKDGATDYICRFHRMDIRVTPGTKTPVALKLTATVLLTTEDGTHFVGSARAFRSKIPEKNLRLDPEGIRVGRDGAIYISDEYGPVIYRFDAKGKRVGILPVPQHFRVPKPGKSNADELPPRNTVGRQPNRGMEGLAITPTSSKLLGAMQGPLIQDGALDKDNNRIGINNRLLEVDLVSGKSREFVYQLDDPVYSVCEILAVNDSSFLVLERDRHSAKHAVCKKIFLIDLTGATDVSHVATLPSKALPLTIKPVKKRLFLDLLNSKFKIAGPDCPDKFEGLAFGPNLADGRLLLLVTSDNDFLVDKPFRLYAFAIDRADLPGFRAQQFAERR